MAVLTERFQRALGAAFGEEYADADPVIRPSQFADFQANAALAAGQAARRAARATSPSGSSTHLDVDGVAEAPEISGPGFVNLRLARRLDRGAGQRSSAATSASAYRLQEPQTVPIDYSAPNVAKEMHVGHLRTTVVGDALARTLEHLGHDVIRQNHIGDWGTPFGMLIEHLLDVGEDSAEARLLVDRPNDFYQAARAEFDGDEAFADARPARASSRCRPATPTRCGCGTSWSTCRSTYFNRIYSTLGVTLTDDDLAGESTLQRRARRHLRRARAAGHRDR